MLPLKPFGEHHVQPLNTVKTDFTQPERSESLNEKKEKKLVFLVDLASQSNSKKLQYEQEYYEKEYFKKG